MANDIDMEIDLRQMDSRTQVYKDLFRCYCAKWIDGNIEEANRLKEEFIKKYKTWGNYY